jgi:N-acyl homoserine lactone hydrolase
MTASVRGFTTGWLETDLAGLLEGGEGTIRIPVLSYLVDHPKGSLVFDTGLHTDMRDDPVARIGRLADYFVSELAAGTAIHERTEALAVAPDMIVCSHLHFDHCGGNELLGDVPVVVQRAEWEAAHGGDTSAAYLPADYDTGQDVRLVDGEHDLFGDGSVVCIPTPGHTAGHQSLRVRTADRELVLTGDACYFRESLERSKLPLFGHDRAQQLRTFATLRALEAAGAHLVFGHDPAQWSDDTPRQL